MANNHHYEVIIGNIGTVYDGEDKVEALKHYTEYVEQSKSGHGRAGHEPVTLMLNGEISQEHYGDLPDNY